MAGFIFLTSSLRDIAPFVARWSFFCQQLCLRLWPLVLDKRLWFLQTIVTFSMAKMISADSVKWRWETQLNRIQLRGEIIFMLEKNWDLNVVGIIITIMLTVYHNDNVDSMIKRSHLWLLETAKVAFTVSSFLQICVRRQRYTSKV